MIASPSHTSTAPRLFKCANYIRGAFPVIVLPHSLVTRRTVKMFFFFFSLLRERQKATTASPKWEQVT